MEGALAIGLVLLIVSLISRSRRSDAAETTQILAPAAPLTDQQIVEKAAQGAADGTASPEALDHAAEIARQIGLGATAAVLAQKADDAWAADQAGGMLRSPLPEASDDAWTRYARYWRQGKLGTVSPGYQLGLFLLGAQVIGDAGLMTNVRKGDYKGRTVWIGDWVSPWSEKVFLADAAAQYNVFLFQQRQYAAVIRKSFAKAIGTAILGEPATFSGLLGVAKQIGPGGLGRWIDVSAGAAGASGGKVEADKVYRSTNGMF